MAYFFINAFASFGRFIPFQNPPAEGRVVLMLAEPPLEGGDEEGEIFQVRAMLRCRHPERQRLLDPAGVEIRLRQISR